MTQVDEAPEGSPVLRWILIAGGVLALIVLGRYLGGYLEDFKDWVGTLGVWGPLIFMGVYSGAIVAFVPGSILTLAAGAIFGVVWGTAYVFVAATVGACVAFLIARHLARDAVARRIEGNRRFAAIDRAIAGEGRKITFLLRLSPVFPFSLLNYALGLTRVGFADYTIASIGMLPGTLLYVYLGSIAGLAAGATESADTLRTALLVVGLIATALVTLLITRTAQRALREATGEAEAE